jgi:NAD(P)-dependent dehydrogenase (short-subunit alcohol dehydrogenase family)
MVNAAPVALVTGGAHRIGRAIVEDLAAHGWAVAIHAHHSRGEAEALAASIGGSGGRAAAVDGDIADTTMHAGVIAAAAKALGPMTLLVNNASMFEKDTFGALDRALFDRQIAVNLAGPIFLAQAFAAALPTGIEGNVVNLLDQRVYRPSPAYFSYQLAKSALLTATDVMAKALAPRIRVNGIAPGPVLPSATQSAEGFTRKLEATLLKRAPELTEFGRTVRYFVEARSVTGQVVALDSGEHLAP